MTQLLPRLSLDGQSLPSVDCAYSGQFEPEYACTDSYEDFIGGMYKFLSFSEKHYRDIGNPKKEECLTGPLSISETIGRSVFEYWHKREDYLPENLRRWAERHSMTIESLIPQQTVKADDPTVVVPD